MAPNIFYLGNAGVVKYGGLRIAGISGIYKPHDYEKSKIVGVVLFLLYSIMLKRSSITYENAA